MAFVTEIHDHLRQWLDGNTSLHQFEDWFIPATWSHTSHDQEESIIDEIEMNLSEYSDGVISPDQLRCKMQECLERIPSNVLIRDHIHAGVRRELELIEGNTSGERDRVREGEAEVLCRDDGAVGEPFGIESAAQDSRNEAHCCQY